MSQADDPLTTTTPMAAAASAPSMPITKVVRRPLPIRLFDFRETTLSELKSRDGGNMRLAILGAGDAYQR
jgi:hypothetical protein